MKTQIIFSLLLVIVTTITSCAEPDKEKRKEQQIHQKIDELLSQMTFEEKIGQMSQRVVYAIDDRLKQDIKEGKIGSLLIIKNNIFSPEAKNRLQKIAVEETRLGIPLITGHDVIHGFKTIFPTSLAQSCSWDTSMVKATSAIAAKEASAYGIDWTFAPMIDVSRDPRWGRIAECYGEDTYLNAIMGAAAVNGFQGQNVSKKDKIVSCLKHFVGYGAAMGGRDYQYTEISERTINEVYLPPFKAGVEAGALTVMSAFNDINGTPSTANKKLLRTTLKEKWHFPGFIVSDWDAVEQLIYHGYAIDSIDAVVKAVKAGIDMEMKSGILYAIDSGRINEEILDEAVKRVLYVKYKKGLFDQPYTDESRQQTDILTKAHREFARTSACKTMVLLENKNDVLPIINKAITISVIGPFAKEQNLMGWWHSLGNNKDVISPLQGLRQNAPESINVIDKITETTDIIIACVGEKYNTFGENNCRSNINLPDRQNEFITNLKKHKKPIVTIIFNGRPLTLVNEKENSDALLIAWHPGTEAGNALADIIFGKVNPSGKLTTGFPLSVGHIPTFYNHRNSGRPNMNKYMHQTSEPLYPFGYGLSYTSFQYSNLMISKKTIRSTENLEVKASISNIGSMDGTEIVQLYVQDVVGSTTRPVKELKGFKRIFIKAGASKEVKFIINAKDLSVLDENMQAKVEPGEFNIWVATNSKEGLKSRFEIIE